jgi:mannan polymerase II complex MNN10 subunit
MHVLVLMEGYRQSPLGGGGKIVILVASNLGGGVMEWKGAQEWAIERATLRNKREYARHWGYELEIVNMMARRKYAHEWRGGWEKADMIRNTMEKYPDAEWCAPLLQLPFIPIFVDLFSRLLT